MPYNVRMAYPTGANLNSLLLQQLNFRTSGNYPISSLYTLYANGQGQTYWSNTISPSALSSFSTSIGIALVNQYVTLSTLIDTTYGTGLSGELSTLEYYTYSSFSSVFNYLSSIQSTNLNYAFLSTANSFQIQLNSYYQSTLNVCISTVNTLSNVSSYNSAVNQLYLSTQLWLSTMSTGMGIQDATTSTLLIGLINYGLTSTVVWTQQQLSTISSSQVSANQLNLFSTSINNALLSTSASLSRQISTISTMLSYDDTRLSTLETNFNYFSTTGAGVLVSSFFSTNISPINSNIISLSSGLYSTNLYIAQLSSANGYSISCLTGSTNQNIAEISYLSTQFAYITTSSILEGIYSTFMELEQYTVNLINSTNAAYVYYLSTSLSTQTSLITSVIVSTVNTAASTSISTLSNQVSTALSTITSNISSSLYNLTTQVSTITGNTNTTLSSLVTTQFITLSGTNLTATLNFASNTNFVVKVNNITNIANNIYQVTYNQSNLSGIPFKQGVILLDISTNTQAYTQNSNLLSMNFNRWSAIQNQSVWPNLPSLANSAYRMEYIYSIYNSNLYTTLANIWPYQNTYNLSVSSIGSNTRIDPLNRRIYSTGTQLRIGWSMYLFSTFGVANFSSYVNFDVNISGATTVTYGPYHYRTSTATITMPNGGYSAGAGYVSTTFTSYVIGEPANGAVLTGAAYY